MDARDSQETIQKRARLAKEIQLQELQLSLKRMEMRKIDLLEELKRLEENYKATIKAIEELEREVNPDAR